MKILYSHLKVFKFNIDIKIISNSLFQLGMKIFILDDLIDIEFTPNKGDWFISTWNCKRFKCS